MKKKIIFDITHLSNAFLEHFLQGVAPLRDIGILLPTTLTQMSISNTMIFIFGLDKDNYIGSK